MSAFVANLVEFDSYFPGPMAPGINLLILVDVSGPPENRTSSNAKKQMSPGCPPPGLVTDDGGTRELSHAPHKLRSACSGLIGRSRLLDGLNLRCSTGNDLYAFLIERTAVRIAQLDFVDTRRKRQVLDLAGHTHKTPIDVD